MQAIDAGGMLIASRSPGLIRTRCRVDGTVDAVALVPSPNAAWGVDLS